MSISQEIEKFKARVMQLVGARILIAIPGDGEIIYRQGVLGYDQEEDRFFLTDTDDQRRTHLLGHFVLRRVRVVAEAFNFLELLPAVQAVADDEGDDEWPELIDDTGFSGVLKSDGR